MAESSKVRNTGASPGSDLAEILRPFAVKFGGSICKYPNEDKPVSAKLIIGALPREHELLVALKTISENLSFTNAELEKALKAIYADIKFEVKMTDEKKNDWIFTIIMRIRNMCRAVHQGETKADHKAKRDNKEMNVNWVLALPWRSSTAGASSAKAESPGPQAPAKIPVLYKYFGLDTELGCAWRAQSDAPKALRDISVDTDLETDGIVLATFLGGDTHSYDGEAAVRFLAMFRGAGDRAGASVRSVLWSGTHVITKHSLEIKQRVDRQLLLSLYEQSRQILQVRMDKFGDVPDQKQLPPDHATLKLALDFMVPLAESFKDDAVDIDGLKKQKKIAESRLGVSQAREPVQVQKRPASGENEDKEEKPVTKKKKTTRTSVCKKRPAKKMPAKNEDDEEDKEDKEEDGEDDEADDLEDDEADDLEDVGNTMPPIPEPQEAQLWRQFQLEPICLTLRHRA